MIKITNWYIPSTLTYHLIQNRFFFLIINSTKLTSCWKLPSKPAFNNNTRILTLTGINSNIIKLVKIFIETSLIYSTTIKFKGKGFKLIKNRSILSLKFNFAHPQLLFPTKTITFKTGKNKITLLNANTVKLMLTSSALLQIRQTNVYTKNGLRLKRQILYRRKGKTLNS